MTAKRVSSVKPTSCHSIKVRYQFELHFLHFPLLLLLLAHVGLVGTLLHLTVSATIDIPFDTLNGTKNVLILPATFDPDKEVCFCDHFGGLCDVACSHPCMVYVLL